MTHSLYPLVPLRVIGVTRSILIVILDLQCLNTIGRAVHSSSLVN